MNTSAKPIIIGIGGTNGAGKDTVQQVLKDKYGFFSASATEMFNVELQKRGLPTDRLHKSELSAEWRREHGMGVVVDKGLEFMKADGGQYKGMVVGSLRHPGEADRVHELGGKMLWVDADPKIRYQRVQDNLENRGRHIEDQKTFEEFLAEEKREMTPVGDAATLNTLAVKERADCTIMNAGDFEQLYKQLDEVIEKLT